MIKSTDLHGKYPLTDEQIGSLLTGGIQIVNRYSLMFHAQSYSTQIIGHDDYQNVLAAVRLDLQRRREEIRKEVRRGTEPKIPREE